MADPVGRSIDRQGFEHRHNPPSALENLQEILSRGRGKRLFIFVDYDGTLTPITPTPDTTFITPVMHRAVIKLATKCSVAVLSGRDLQDVRRRVNVDNIIYGGCHGFDIAGPNGLRLEHERGLQLLPVLEQVHHELSSALASIEGVIIERKRFVITVHFRLVREEDERKVLTVVDEVAGRYPQLKKTAGKKIYELLPAADWNKGAALLRLLDLTRQNGRDTLPIYIGDDTSDEDAFQAVQERGIGIHVGENDVVTAASYNLRNPDEVGEFLLELAPFCRGGEGP